MKNSAPPEYWVHNKTGEYGHFRRRREPWGPILLVLLALIVILLGGAIWTALEQQRAPVMPREIHTDSDNHKPVGPPYSLPRRVMRPIPPSDFYPEPIPTAGPSVPQARREPPTKVVDVLEAMKDERESEGIAYALNQARRALKLLVPKTGGGGFDPARPVAFEIVRITPLQQIERKARRYQSADGSDYASMSNGRIVVQYRRGQARGIPPVRTACIYFEDESFVGAVALTNQAALRMLDKELANVWREPDHAN